MSQSSLVYLLFLFLLFSCTTERHFTRHIDRTVRTSPVFSRAFTGFTLLDPATGRTLCDWNGDHCFTPASNMKVFTLYACLKVLGDSVPGFRYNDDASLNIFGTGDPTFLHPKFQYWQRGFSFLKNHPTPEIYWTPNRDGWQRFGPGWAWDDVDEDYSPEMSDWPLYANVRRIFAPTEGVLSIEPSFFRREDFFADSLSTPLNQIGIERYSNAIRYNPKNAWEKNFEQWVPIRSVTAETRAMLADTLKKNVIQLVETSTAQGWSKSVARKIFYSTPLDTVLRRMMYQSDNFIADQMLLVCADKKFDLMRPDTLIRWMLKDPLYDLPQRPRWVDGSGLSRYNLASPRDLSVILLHLWREQPRERLFSLFPAGGVSGTLSDWYGNEDGKPYVFAKTGSMSGVHCLSGYVVCKSGKTLIFSFMHNNFVGSNKAWKVEMQRILKEIAAGR